jgi:hypothetical protein
MLPILAKLNQCSETDAGTNEKERRAVEMEDEVGGSLKVDEKRLITQEHGPRAV